MNRISNLTTGINPIGPVVRVVCMGCKTLLGKVLGRRFVQLEGWDAKALIDFEEKTLITSFS